MYSPCLKNKLRKNENVTSDALVNICIALQSDIGNKVELIPDERGIE